MARRGIWTWKRRDGMDSLWQLVSFIYLSDISSDFILISR